MSGANTVIKGDFEGKKRMRQAREGEGGAKSKAKPRLGVLRGEGRG